MESTSTFSSYYSEIGKSDCYQWKLACSLFNIRFPLKKDKVPLLKEKQQGLWDVMQCDLSQVSRIHALGYRLPWLYEHISAIQDSFDEWSSKVSKDPKKKEALLAKIQIQYENLLAAAKVAEGLSAYVPDEKCALANVHSMFDYFFKPFIQGERKLEADAAQTYTFCLWDSVKSEPKVEKISVDEQLLDQERQLFRVSRLASIFATKQLTLQKQSGSVNQVYKIYHEGNVVAYFKACDGGDPSSAIMETLMWDLACKFGKNHMFAPTKKTRLYTWSNFGKGKTKDTMWIDEANIWRTKTAGPPVVGGIQPAQPGISLKAAIAASPGVDPIPRQTELESFGVTIAFGMFDAHDDNILINEGKAYFFDNTRSMPHSNTVLDWAGAIVPSYRSSLLQLDGAYVELSPEDRAFLKAEVKQYQEKFAGAKAFVESKDMTAKLAKLPKGWWNGSKSMDAMKARLDAWEKALDDPSVKTLQDIVYKIYPEQRFLLALTLVYSLPAFLGEPIDAMKARELEKKGFAYLGGTGSLSGHITKCYEYAIEPNQLRKWCYDPTLSFEDILKKMAEAAKKVNTLSPSECNKMWTDTNKLSGVFKYYAVQDNKDIAAAFLIA